MSRPIARFAVVGSMVTAVDVGCYLALARRRRARPVSADLPALAVASGVSWVLHRAVTFRDDPYRRWLTEHEAFAFAALTGAAVDVAVLSALRPSTRHELAAKLPAVAAAGATRWLLHRRALFRVIRADQVARSERGPAPGDVRLAVVIPAYHEVGRIGATIGRLRRALAGVEGGVEIVVVDDGSGDGTAEEARAAGADVVVVLPANRGKGAAVRAGVLAASGQTIAFTDADLAYAPSQLLGMLEEVEAGWDVVVGSRRHEHTTTLVRAGRLREIGGRVVNWFTHAVLLGRYRDTQCGLKAFRSDAAQEIFGRSRIDGFAFDIEIFVVAERNGLVVTDVPVTVENSTRSTVRVIRDVSRLVRDLFRIRRWAREGAYQLGQ